MSHADRPSNNSHHSEPDPCDALPGLMPEGGLDLPRPPRHVAPARVRDQDDDSSWDRRSGYGQGSL